MTISRLSNKAYRNLKALTDRINKMLSPERLQKLSSDFKDKDEDQKPLEGEQDSSRSKPQLELHPDSLLSEYY